MGLHSTKAFVKSLPVLSLIGSMLIANASILSTFATSCSLNGFEKGQVTYFLPAAFELSRKEGSARGASSELLCAGNTGQILLTPLQNINPKYRSRLKQTPQVRCLHTYNMNMKLKRTPLKIEFKQFQRLPEWPTALRPTSENRALEETNVPKIPIAALLIQENKYIRSLAE